MALFPYAHGPRRFAAFLEKVRQAGVPEVANRQWLAQIGFASKNDPTYLSVMKFLGLADAEGRPTRRWLAFRGGTSSKDVLRDTVRAGYRDLFETYPDAPTRSSAELQEFFRGSIPLGTDVIEKTAATFRFLCHYAGIDDTEPERADAAPQVEVRHEAAEDSAEAGGLEAPSPNIALTINIHLDVPSTADLAVYESIFRALRKTFLRRRG